MSLRLKIVLALVLLATCATAAVSASSYVSTRRELNEVVDRSLTDAAANPAVLLRSLGRGPGFGPGRGGSGAGDADDAVGRPARVFDMVLAQLIDGDGVIVRSPSSGELPIDETDRAVADGSFRGAIGPRDVTIDGEAARMLTIPVSRLRCGANRPLRSRDRAGAARRSEPGRLYSVALVDRCRGDRRLADRSPGDPPAGAPHPGRRRRRRHWAPGRGSAGQRFRRNGATRLGVQRHARRAGPQQRPAAATRAGRQP